MKCRYMVTPYKECTKTATYETTYGGKLCAQHAKIMKKHTKVIKIK